jgi:cytochrome P450
MTHDLLTSSLDVRDIVMIDPTQYNHLITILLGALVILAVYLIFAWGKRDKQPLPPGNRGRWPLLGDTLRLLNPSTMAQYQIDCKQVFGNIWRTSVLFNNAVFIASDDLSRELSRVERTNKNATSACFPPHHKALFGSHSVLATSGQEHLRLRSLIGPTLAPSKYVTEIASSAKEFVERCSLKEGYFPLVPELKRFSLRVMLRVLFGNELWIALKSTKQLDSLIDNILTLLFAGTDTTASVLTSAFFILAQDKDLLNRLQGSLDDEKAIEAFLTETQRLYPAAPFTMRVVSAEDGLRVGGYHIPKGWFVAYALAAMMLDDEAAYPNTKKFDMGRWYSSSKGDDATGESFSHLSRSVPPIWSFGGGHRTCPGRFLANAEGIALIQEVLRNQWDWTLDPNQNLTYQYNPGFFPVDGLKIQLRHEI